MLLFARPPACSLLRHPLLLGRVTGPVIANVSQDDDDQTGSNGHIGAVEMKFHVFTVLAEKALRWCARCIGENLELKPQNLIYRVNRVNNFYS